MDYNATTTCETEMKKAVCLCGSHLCRQSFITFSGADSLHSILRSFGPLMVFRTLIQASGRVSESASQRVGFRVWVRALAVAREREYEFC